MLRVSIVILSLCLLGCTTSGDSARVKAAEKPIAEEPTDAQVEQAWPNTKRACPTRRTRSSVPARRLSVRISADGCAGRCTRWRRTEQRREHCATISTIPRRAVTDLSNDLRAYSFKPHGDRSRFIRLSRS